MRKFAGVLVGVLLCATSVLAQEKDHVVYVPKTEDAVLKEMEQVRKDAAKAAEEATQKILDQQEEAKKTRKDAKKRLRFDLSKIVRPENPEAFEHRVWFSPPVPQYYTGSCWSFSATSFLESEIHRQTGQEIKLSEMWTVYWEYVNKARGFIHSRGETIFEEGSESAAAMRVLKEHGTAPRSVYEGVLAEDGRFDHVLMHQRMQDFLDWCKEENYWDEDFIISTIRSIMDQTMGRPPQSFEWQGRMITPADFRDEVCRINLDDYVSLMSTLSQPFWQRGEYTVPDNWWHDASYINLPLEDWYGAIVSAIDSGYSMVIGGDVSEPGLNGEEDIAVIPSFDIPGDAIDQDAREFRFDNGTSADDHGIHLVGHTRIGGHDWFLIKDSNRSSRHGKFKGHYMYRDDFVRLKMLTFTVHRDVVKNILKKVEETEKKAAEANAQEAAKEESAQ